MYVHVPLLTRRNICMSNIALVEAELLATCDWFVDVPWRIVCLRSELELLKLQTLSTQIHDGHTYIAGHVTINATQRMQANLVN